MNRSSFFLWRLTTMIQKLPSVRHSYDHEQYEQYENSSRGSSMSITNTSTCSNTHLCHPQS